MTADVDPLLHEFALAIGFPCGDYSTIVIREKLRDAILERLRQSEWRTMDSAPKDGTRVLLCGIPRDSSRKVVAAGHVGFFDKTEYLLEHEGGELYRKVTTRIMSTYWRGEGEDTHFTPVAWQPLPSPPSEGEDCMRAAMETVEDAG